MVHQLQFLGTSEVLVVLSSAGELVFIHASTASYISQLKSKGNIISFAISPDGRCISTMCTETKYALDMFRVDEILNPTVNYF
jgi:hypothetical protein